VLLRTCRFTYTDEIFGNYTVLVVQVDPVLTPVLPVSDKLEIPAIQRVERVRHPDAMVPIMRIRRS
jgi:hypothetical protein